MGEYEFVYDGRMDFPNVMSKSTGPSKVKVEIVKNIRRLTGCGLKEAKDSAETILEDPGTICRVTTDPRSASYLQHAELTTEAVIEQLRHYGVTVCRDRSDRDNARLKIDDQIEDLAIQAIRERAYDRARQLMQILEDA